MNHSPLDYHVIKSCGPWGVGDSESALKHRFKLVFTARVGFDCQGVLHEIFMIKP